MALAFGCQTEERPEKKVNVSKMLTLPLAVCHEIHDGFQARRIFQSDCHSRPVSDAQAGQHARVLRPKDCFVTQFPEGNQNNITGRFGPRCAASGRG